MKIITEDIKDNYVTIYDLTFKASELEEQVYTVENINDLISKLEEYLSGNDLEEYLSGNDTSITDHMRYMLSFSRDDRIDLSPQIIDTIMSVCLSNQGILFMKLVPKDLVPLFINQFDKTELFNTYHAHEISLMKHVFIPWRLKR